MYINESAYWFHYLSVTIDLAKQKFFFMAKRSIQESLWWVLLSFLQPLFFIDNEMRFISWYGAF